MSEVGPRRMSEITASGHRKRPFSRRFAHTQSPLPSQNSSFSRFALRVGKQKDVPAQRIARQPVADQTEESFKSLAQSVDPAAR
jgi:hypothetical protein